ncbi:MAG: DUF5805 domain-containing protein [Halobacteria archaeon]
MTEYISINISEKEKKKLKKKAKQKNKPLAVFCRERIHAGDRLWDSDGDFLLDIESNELKSEDDAEVPANNEDLEKLVLQNLNSRKTISIKELTAEITEDLESEVAEILENLQEDGVVKYSPTDRGWVKK